MLFDARRDAAELTHQVTEQDLRSTFSPFGPLRVIDMPPKSTNEKGRSLARGFAFVWFVERRDAERAMPATNGKPIKRANKTGTDKQSKVEGRPIAVDWALSKDRWDAAQGRGNESEMKSNGDVEVKEEDEESIPLLKDDNGEQRNEEGEPGNLEESGEDESDVSRSESVKPALPDTSVGSTLFIRNIPFEATEPDLTQLFRAFGPLRYARLTMDKITGRSKGSGFVCFWNKAHADAAMQEVERVAAETNASMSTTKNPFSMQSVLTTDPSSGLANRVTLLGRVLDVNRAVTRDEADQLKEDGERSRHSGDKRNTYLMREGVIFPNSPAAETLPPVELEKRQSSFNARKALLRSNPSLYISKTRLSVRQLPLFATDRTLKRLAIHAVRTFDDEVKDAEREGLSRAEVADTTMSIALEGKTKKRGERATAVIQSKIVRQAEKTDPLVNLGRSKGYGFLEMRTHNDALKVLRWVNNNPNIAALLWEWWTTEMREVMERLKGGLKDNDGKEEIEGRIRRIEERLADKPPSMKNGKTLMVEFSIENVQVVKRRTERIGQARIEGSSKRQSSEVADDPPRKRAKVFEKPEGKSRSKTAARRGAEEKSKDGEPEKHGLEKLGAKLGSLIGRKRRQRFGK